MQDKDNKIIPILTKNGENAVSARDLHSFLDSKERFSSWFNRQLQYGFREGSDFVGCETFNALANQNLQDYVISLDMAKEISMIQKTEQGKKARQYFIEVDKQQRNQSFTSNQIYTSTLDNKELKLAKKEKVQLAQLKETREELSIIRSAPRICGGCGKIVRGKKGLYAHSRHCEGTKTLSLFEKGGNND